MEMVGHEAEAQQAHWHASTGRRQQFEKAAIVRVVMKHLTAGIAAVQDVVANTADGGARGTWHVNSLEVPNLAGKEKSRMSPFTPTCPRKVECPHLPVPIYPHVNSLEVPNLAGKEKSRMSQFTPSAAAAPITSWAAPTTAPTPTTRSAAARVTITWRAGA